MAVVLHVVFPSLSEGEYDQLKEKVGWVDSPPDGGIAHVAWWEGDGCHFVDIWESEVAWAHFGQDRIGPAAGELGLSMEAIPHFHQPHELLIVRELEIP